MKKMLRLTILAFGLVLFCQLYADVKSPELAREIARNFYLSMFDSNGNIDKNQMLITLAETRKSGGNDLFYVYNIDTRGFVIISAWDATIPILGFSNKGSYDAYSEIEVPAFAELLNGYEEQIRDVIEQYLPATPDIAMQWEIWQSPSASPENGRSVNPLLSTTWNQSCYYNELCPEDNGAPSGYCNHVPAGCVALAMAQVLKYWNYPATGTGYHEYYISPYGLQSADFENTSYGWENMPNSIGSSNSDVATLIYHCAVSVNMQFGPVGSGASTNMARSSLVNYFNYSQDAQYLTKSNFSNSEWETMLRDNLDAGRPVIYRGDGSGGHAWVCDGYAANNYFHMNWGWGGYANGYFYLSNLNPNGANFTNNQAAIMGIVPGEIFVEPPVDLQAQVTGSDVLLSWSAPVEPQWIHWDNGINNGSITIQGGSSFYAAACWTLADLELYDGLQISKVSVFIDSDIPEYVLKIWKGENGANLVYAQALGSINENSWNTVDLISPLSLDVSEELYIGFSIIDQPNGIHSLGIDSGPAVAGKGGLISFNGYSWSEMSAYGINANWNIQAYLTGDDGVDAVLLNELIEEPVTAGNLNPIFEQKQTKPQAFLKSPASRGLIGYNVYRDAQKINEDYIEGTSYLDDELPSGTYEYYVTSVYNVGESEPSNFVSISPGLLLHNFMLTAGWNSISTNLIPVDSEIEIICNPLANDLIIMQNMTGYYYPANNSNTLQNWDNNSGYFIKVDQDCELPFQGFSNEIKTLTLQNGWNLIPVLSDCDVNTEELFNGIINYIRIVKEASGTGVYWPSRGINTLPVLEPGKAYYVKVFSTKTITFPSCE